MKRILLMALAATACGPHPKAPAANAPAYYQDDLPPAEDLSDLKPKRDGLAQRLLSTFMEDDQVVARTGGDDQHAAPKDVGDSKLWSGIALAVLDCDEGAPVLMSILASIAQHGGGIVRFDPLPQEYIDNSNETSIDMVTGVMFGLTERARKCPGDAPAIKAAWDQHRAFVQANGGKLADRVKDYGMVQTPGFHWAWDLTGYLLGTNGKPDGKEAAELDLLGMIEGVVVKKEACYRIHLGLLMLLEAARGGDAMSRFARWTACQELKPTGIPLADWICERMSLRQYFVDFDPDAWQYHSQRCNWEKPDGDGDGQPGLEGLLLYDVGTK